MKEFKCGTVSIIGKPNTGKSTLINSITGRRISAVSDKPNTTRNKILGVLNSAEYQIIFLDTPGIQKSNKFLTLSWHIVTFFRKSSKTLSDWLKFSLPKPMRMYLPSYSNISAGTVITEDSSINF